MSGGSHPGSQHDVSATSLAPTLEAQFAAHSNAYGPRREAAKRSLDRSAADALDSWQRHVGLVRLQGPERLQPGHGRRDGFELVPDSQTKTLGEGARVSPEACICAHRDFVCGL